MISIPSKPIELMLQVQRIRYEAPDRVPFEVFETAASTGSYISRTKVMMEGRIEPLHLQDRATERFFAKTFVIVVIPDNFIVYFNHLGYFLLNGSPK